MKEHNHLGVYGLIINDNKLVLIKKYGGPYDKKLDLPGGRLEVGETLEEALKRELKEEIGIELKQCELFDVGSVCFEYDYHGEMLNWHHMGIFYKVLDYDDEIKSNVMIDNNNDDSLGADFYEIDKLKKEELSEIAILVLEKLGYNLKY